MKSPAELELNVAIAKLRGDIAVLNARIDGVGSRISDHDSSTRDSVNWNLALAGIAIGVAAFFGIGGITYSIFTQKQAKKKIEGAIESLDDYKAQFESKLKSKLKSHERDFLTFLDNAMRRDRIYSRLDAEKFDDPQIFADLAHLGQADPLERKVIASEVLTYEGKIDGQLVRLAKSIVDNKN